MTNFRFRDIAEIVGILAIVASLIFVGLQIKQRQINQLRRRLALGGANFVVEMIENP